MRKQPILSLVTTFSLIVAPTTLVQAAIVNGSFESNNFTGWTTTGQTTVTNSGFGVTPVNGNYQALLQTLQNTTGVSTSALESFLGLGVGTLSSLGVTEGSAIQQTFSANAGDKLSFSWNFLTNQDPDLTYNDFAFFTLTNNVTQLADTFSPLLVPSLTTPLSSATGYQLSIPIALTGSYTLGFGVVDVDTTGGGDTTVNSGLLIDNVQLLNNFTPTPIPEPRSIIGLLAAVGFGICYRKRPR
jgi:hypothetical protein